MNDLTQRNPANAITVDAMMRAEIDIQISTAHAYPRSLTRVARNVTDLVTMSKGGAEECIYSLPRSGTTIVGPSIRLAEILFSQWGNCTGGSRVVEVNRKEGYVEAEGIFHDLETNSKTVRRTRRNIKNKNGGLYNDDMITMTGNAAGSIAFRNAVLAGVPKAVWSEAYSKAEDVIRGSIETLPERRTKALKAMSAFGLSPDDICKIIGVEGHKDIGLQELVAISGLHTSLMQEETTAEKLREQAEESANAKPKPKKVEARKETPHDSETGEVISDAKVNKPDEAKPDAKSAEEDRKTEPQKDQSDAGTKTEQETAKRNEPDLEQFGKLMEMIKNDLTDADDPQEVVDLYQHQITMMEEHAPELHKELLAEIEAHKEEKSSQS